MTREELPRLARLLWSEWDEAPAAMSFEAPWGEVLDRSIELLDRVGSRSEAILAEPASADEGFRRDALDLFVRAPAIINVVLNWKICLEQGLPLHPTHYFEVNDRTRNSVAWPADLVAEAVKVFSTSIRVARALMRLDPVAVDEIRSLRAGIDPAVLDFVFTSVPDKYTWRASEPAKILALASRIEKDRDFYKGPGLGHVARLEGRSVPGPTGLVVDPPGGLVVGAAHGSLVPGLILAETLGWKLWYIRFSMFKRNDREPVISESDIAKLAPFRISPVLIFDEDVAKGTTLRLFTEKLFPLFDNRRSASVLRHGLASFRPDFSGVQWYD
ncbi:MAG TPA: hypothetical protein VMV44_00395 [Rectinemataceae bacterium]|nr:hypothetical protein [Rectinemataceae bacterium]